jgi:hypothetical protein
VWSEQVIENGIETVQHSLVVADVSGDGHSDVVVAGMEQGADPDLVRAFVNDGAEHFSSAAIASGGSHNLQSGDLDGDGDSDLFGANWRSSTSVGAPVRLWWNLAPVSSPTPESPTPIPAPTPTPTATATPLPPLVGDVPMCKSKRGRQVTALVPQSRVQRSLDRGLTRGECLDPVNGRVLCKTKRGKRVNVLLPDSKVQRALDKGFSTLGECGTE